MSRLLPLLLAASAVSLTACGSGSCPDGFLRDNDGNCIEVDDDDDTDSTDTDTDTNNDSDHQNADGDPVGSACSNADDCAADLCVFQYSGDVSGVCTESCNTWADCGEAFWECCDLSNGGFVCTPDSWVDEMNLDCD